MGWLEVENHYVYEHVFKFSHTGGIVGLSP